MDRWLKHKQNDNTDLKVQNTVFILTRKIYTFFFYYAYFMQNCFPDLYIFFVF